jgi:4-hydroxythreonine-4-phosphate dehydrogenase
MTATASPAPLALTMGDPAGIGGEIALMAWHRCRSELAPFFILDDPKRLERLAQRIGLEVSIAAITHPEEAATTFADALPVVALSRAVRGEPGRQAARDATLVVEAIDRAIEFVQKGRAAAIVTNPVHKTALYEAGFPDPGHTEYLARRAGLTTAPVMMLAILGLRVVPVTIHMSLAHAIAALNVERIVHAARVTAAALKTDFGVARPRLAVAGLNPHAGESGHLGREEIEIIGPAIDRLVREGIAVQGPLAPDAMFHKRARTKYDAAICMYHDQALIPLKTLDFDHGVNVTLGLPFVRTSPDHGTAFDIAGTGQANPASLIAALALADTMVKNRAKAAGALVG